MTGRTLEPAPLYTVTVVYKDGIETTFQTNRTSTGVTRQGVTMDSNFLRCITFVDKPSTGERFVETEEVFNLDSVRYYKVERLDLSVSP